MLTLFTETVIENKLQPPSLRKEFQVPRRNGSYDRSDHTQRNRNHPSTINEQTALAGSLASASSSFFRHENLYPRSFLWRVVGNNKVIEIQSTDFSRSDRTGSEAGLTLCFEFQDNIIPLGVTFADLANSDQIHAFICTSKNEIFNLRLPVNAFHASSKTEYVVEELCKPVDTSSLHIDTVYQLYANNPHELFAAFVGGRIQRIHRKADNETWHNDHYDDATWSSTIRGMVGRRTFQTIEHGSLWLAPTTAQGMVASSDTTYLYTLCLNHTLRIWQLTTGRLVESRDLLDVARETNEKLQLNPAEPGLIRLVSFPKRHTQTLVTYTPHEGGQFKFWDIRGGLTGDLEIKDRFPDMKLNPPDPDPSGNTVWSLIAFDIAPPKRDGPAQIWLLWRNNNYHQVYTMHFDDLLDLPEAWKTKWVAVDNSIIRITGPDMVLSDPVDPTTRWLDFLFYPERYSDAVLETTLSKYQDITGTSLSSSRKRQSLRERLCLTIASTISLRKYDTSEMDYDRFSIDTDHQWRNFWRLLESVNENRLAPLSLTFDPALSIAWVNFSDKYAAIRECSRAELLRANPADVLANSEELIAARWPHRKVVDDSQLLEGMSTIMNAASTFRESFSPEMNSEFYGAIEEQMFTDSELSTPDRIVLIFNQIGLSEGLSEGAEQRLLRDLEPLGGAGGLHNDLVFATLKLLSAHNSKRHKSDLKNTASGSNLVSTALLEDINVQRTVLLDLLALVVFIDESNDFDPPELFDSLVLLLKEQERNLWLMTHFRQSSSESQKGNATSSNSTSAGQPVSEGRRLSIMEDIFGKYVRPQSTDARPLMYLIVEVVAEMQKWASGRDAVTYDDATIHVQCYLLAHGEIDLAIDFLKFLPATPWASYVNGRLRLLRGEYGEAFVSFRRAAYTLACGKAIGDVKEMSASLLSILDAEHFNSGLPRYWQHIMMLFEDQKCYPQAAEAAHLALQGLTASQKEPKPNFRSEILSRLFTAELQCGKFHAAFSVLIQFSDQALQKISVTTLVNAILDSQVSSSSNFGILELLRSLPWSLDPRLEAIFDTHLAGLAQKQSSITPPSSNSSFSSSVDYHSILQAYRLSKGDHRGAAEIQLKRLQIIERSGQSRNDPQAVSLRYAMLTLINIMKCMSPKEAFVLAEVENHSKAGRKRGLMVDNQLKKRKRRIITLSNLRKDYQMVIDKCSRIERGDFGFDNGTEETDDEDLHMNSSKLNGSAMEM